LLDAFSLTKTNVTGQADRKRELKEQKGNTNCDRFLDIPPPVGWTKINVDGSFVVLQTGTDSLEC
jgi:hypothetical protein